MYKLVKIEGIVSTSVVVRVKDGITSSIPNDPSNVDWQEYQEWLAAGNEPLAADE